MKLKLADLKKIVYLEKVFFLAKKRKFNIYLVGGAIRDCILGRDREYLDFDFAVNKNSLNFAKQVARLLKSPFVLLDEPHGCARVIFKQKGFLVNLDFSDFRAKTIEQDLGARDFRINALALNLKDIFSVNNINIKQAIIDPYCGQQDIRKKLVRLIDKQNFQEDPLRMLRAFSLAGRLNFKIENKTFSEIKKNKSQIRRSAAERIREELFKIFSLADSYATIKLLDKTGMFSEIFPEIKPMKNLKQGAYHHLDVWKHSLQTLIELEKIINNPGFRKKTEFNKYLNFEIGGGHSRIAILKLVSLLHDIGKPATFRREKNKIHFYGHERVGAKISQDIANQLKLSSKEIKAIKLLIYAHLRPGFMADILDLSRRAIFRYFRDCQDEAASVALLSLADQRATRGRLTRSNQRKRHEELIRFLIREFFKHLHEEKITPLINGHDVMKHLLLAPGPIIGKILTEVNEAHAEGEIKTKPQALDWAKKFYARTQN
jgi:poly(A) polymerase